MAERPKKEKKESFEQLLQRLEEIVEAIESGDLPLDEAMARFEEGAAALVRCRELLAEAEKRILVLVKDDKGGLKEEPFEAPAGAADEQA